VYCDLDNISKLFDKAITFLLTYLISNLVSSKLCIFFVAGKYNFYCKLNVSTRYYVLVKWEINHVENLSCYLNNNRQAGM